MKREVASGEVEAVSSSASHPTGMTPPPARSRPSRSRASIWLGAIAVIIVAVALGYWTLFRRTDAGPSAPLRTQALTSTAGVEYPGSWSPDGSFFAYCHSANGPLDIFIQSTAGGDPIRLVASPYDDGTPAWSPDNRWIAFASNRGGTMKIYLIPPLGGEERLLIDTELEGLGTEGEAAMNSTPWSPDGRRLAFCRKRDGQIAVWIHDLATGAERQLTRPDAGAMDMLATWSFDGARIAFIRMAPDHPALWVASVENGDAREVLAHDVTEQGLGWAPDDRHLLRLTETPTRSVVPAS